ncbi:ABC transporter ATP-binding protein [Phenylobacterium sp.]|jgi:iron(III) transport system ATP-binding protein|uniref:ABC transporter ATP-binding protein n=1 Tax=Phenylobacterium sp. TaxID=1871053 RepID=UPI002E33E088|nr:ABC transporter ATP-binding protein [Phenylobacterium sp.]HEX2561960.1 ABC transporter ATP-binding protein [Phenylobacterium sp.]
MSGVLEARAVRRRYGRTLAVDGASLALEPGRITGLLGPSGCGKSTLLRCLAGLEPVDGGEVRAGERVLSAPGVHVPPESRDVGLVFQDYALFPHLTVVENVAFGLSGRPKAERRERALAQLERVRLAHRAEAWPSALSGGEQQRVALARALARDPAAILLDEPFSGLDGPLRTEVREATLSALRAAGKAALIVTHDAEDAMLTSDSLALMEAGAILQAGSPRDCFLEPTSLAAARLLGEINTLPIEGGSTAFGAATARDGVLMVRPEGLVIGGEGVPAVVEEVRFAGASAVVALQVRGIRASARVPLASAPRVGDTVRVAIDPQFARPFPTAHAGESRDPS